MAVDFQRIVSSGIVLSCAKHSAIVNSLCYRLGKRSNLIFVGCDKVIRKIILSQPICKYPSLENFFFVENNAICLQLLLQNLNIKR